MCCACPFNVRLFHADFATSDQWTCVFIHLFIFFHIHFHCLVAHKNAGVLFILLIQPSSRFDQITEKKRERERARAERA